MKTDWKPITEAPKDGTKILVWTHRQQVEIAYWYDDRYSKHPQPYWKTIGPWGVREMREHPPLEWTPIPARP